MTPEMKSPSGISRPGRGTTALVFAIFEIGCFLLGFKVCKVLDWHVYGRGLIGVGFFLLATPVLLVVLISSAGRRIREAIRRRRSQPHAF